MKSVATAETESSVLDQHFMSRALELSQRGIGLVSPGPLVGCVLVSPEGECVGEGYYVYEDLRHAETLALEQAGHKAIGATAYVSLEPHAHHGRTPPCTDALIASGIARVVAPIEDPNPLVSGRGFAHLRAMGIQVDTGLMTEAAERVNEKYLHLMRTGRPFVHLKLAVSLDGKVATRTGDSRWITGEEARQRVQQMRHEYDAILVGAGTLRADDPLLTDRSGLPRRRPLIRILLDDRLELSPESRIAQTAHDTPVWVFAGTETDEAKEGELTNLGVEVLKQESSKDLAAVLVTLARRSVQSLLIEGGAAVAGNFLDAGLVNKITFFIAPIIIGGREAPAAVGGTGAAGMAEALQLQRVEIKQHGRDLEITGYPVRTS